MEVLGSLIISILQSIFFYEKKLGISVILFTTITTGIIWYILYKKSMIKNKKALILMIPIILLSSTYFIYGNAIFYFTNIIFILGLSILMFIIATSDKGTVKDILFKCIQLPIELIEDFDCATKTTVKVIKETPKGKVKVIKENLVKILTSLFIVVIVVGIVIALLASADTIFASVFSGVGDVFKNINSANLEDAILRVVICVIIYFVVLTLMLSIQKDKKVEKKEKEIKNTDKFTIKMLLISLNIVYLIFCYIQITSLFTKINAAGTFNYAEYARSGFFQLMIVSFINFVLILISNFNNDNRDNFIKILKVFLIVFTIIIVISSMYRMYMYESAYGLTYLRMLVYIILTTELILFIPTLVYVFTPKVDILKCGGIIGIFAYVVINFINLENIIITRNLNRKTSIVKVDYKYIARIATSNTYSILEDLLSDETISYKDKMEIVKALNEILDDSKNMKWQEFNISKYKIKDKSLEGIIDIEELEIKSRAEEIRVETINNTGNTYIYYEMVNDLEGYRVRVTDSASGTAVWKIEKTIDGGLTYKNIETHIVKTSSEIIFFENGLGFYTLPDTIYCGKADLYMTNDSGKTFKKVDFPDGEFSLSNPDGKQWDECYDYFYLPTQEADGTLQVLVSGGYEGGYNNGETRAKYISKDNGQTWKFVEESSN